MYPRVESNSCHSNHNGSRKFDSHWFESYSPRSLSPRYWLYIILYLGIIKKIDPKDLQLQSFSNVSKFIWKSSYLLDLPNLMSSLQNMKIRVILSIILMFVLNIFDTALLDLFERFEKTRVHKIIESLYVQCFLL